MTSNHQDHTSECDHTNANPGARFCRDCGAPTGPGSAEPMPGSVTARPTRRLRRRTRIIAAIVAVAIAAGIAGLWWTQDTWHSPTEPVDELIAAIATGDTDTFSRILTAAGIDTDSPLLALTLVDGYEPPTGITIGSITYGQPDSEDMTRRKNRDYARVELSYTLAGEHRTTEIDTVRSGDGMWRTWEINPPDLAAMSVTVDAAATSDGEYSIAGTTTTDVRAMAALPGVYQIDTEADPLFQPTTVVAVVGIGTGTRVTLAPELQPEVTGQVAELIRDRADDCATQPGKPDPDCGWRDATGAANRVPGDTEWELNAYPDVTVEPWPDQGDDDPPAIVRTITSGTATATYETMIGEKRTVTVDIYAYGYIDIGTGGGIVFHPTACESDQPIC